MSPLKEPRRIFPVNDASGRAPNGDQISRYETSPLAVRERAQIIQRKD